MKKSAVIGRDPERQNPMTAAQKRLKELLDQQSRNRSRMAEIGLAGEMTDEHRTELVTLEKGIPDQELQIRTARTLVEHEDAEAKAAGAKAKAPEHRDSEDRELVEIRSRVSLTDYFGAALEGRGVDGAAKEYNEARKIGATKFPLELLAPVEERATTDTDTTVTPRRWLDRLFADSAAQRLGVTMESVGAGITSYPITTAGGTPAQRGRAEDAADAVWTVGVTELKPTRNAVRAVFTNEDALRMPGLESALRRDLQMAMTEKIDRTIFLGDDTATPNTGDIVGFNDGRAERLRRGARTHA